MAHFIVLYNSKIEWLVKAIIKTEDLDLSYAILGNALGDTVIEVRGRKEEIGIFKEIYTMVGGTQ